MNVGTLNERITIQYPASSSFDSYGQKINTFATSSTWASVKRTGGSEPNSFGVQTSAAKYVFTVRRDDNITELANIICDNRTYNIVFLEKTSWDKNRYLKITAERRV